MPSVRAALAFVAAGAVVALACSYGNAFAHAQLESISPSNGEVVSVPPAEVVLTFNEPVSLTGGDARVLDDEAMSVSSAPVQSGVTITIPLSADLADGTYTIAYEVVSTDSHRITGASVFHVGAASSEGLDLSRIGGGEVGWGVRTGAVVLSGISNAATFIALGTWSFKNFIDRRSIEHRADGQRRTLSLRPLIVRSAILGAVTLVAAVPFRIARVGGGLDALSNNDVISAELRGPIGQAVAVTAVALLAFAVIVERRAPMWLGAAAAIAGLAGFSLEGHTRAMHLRWAMISSDVVHLGAGTVWLGGIVGLTLAFRSDVKAVPLALLVLRFSNAALVAVGVVSVSGVIMAWIVLPKAGELTTTGYGLALVLKVSLVAVVVGLGAFNRWKLVPTVSAPSGELGEEPAEPSNHVGGARRRLSRIVLAELAMLLTVVGVTAVLVTRSPVSSASSAPPAGPTTTVPPQVFTLAVSGGTGTVDVSITPSRIGANALSLVLRDAEGRIVNPYETPAVEFSQSAADVGPLRPEVRAVAIGQYELTAELGFAGDWEMTVRIRVSDFASETATGTVAIS